MKHNISYKTTNKNATMSDTSFVDDDLALGTASLPTETQLCRAAATKFFEWSETVDARGAHLAMPPLDVLVVWHAFLLNPSAYRTYADEDLDGRLGGKGLDWDALVSRRSSLPLPPSLSLSCSLIQDVPA